MLNHTRLLSICLCMSGLSACTTDTPTSYTTYTYSQPYAYSGIPAYMDGYETTGYSTSPQERGPIAVPETYHVSTAHAPTSHTDVDRQWVNSQNAQGYTIELADGDKAAQVAGALYKAPKNQRTAEVKYQQGGKTYYKGLYGSYPSYDAAQQALSTLPADVKQKAGIKSWGSVQHGVGE